MILMFYFNVIKVSNSLLNHQTSQTLAHHGIVFHPDFLYLSRCFISPLARFTHPRWLSLQRGFSMWC